MPKPNTAIGSVRIISGQWKGRKCPVLAQDGLRPTADRIKETVFNWLAPDIRDARCLDLFAGSGSLGLEALSRYATSVTFVEYSAPAAQHIRRNLERLGAQVGTVISQEAQTFLQHTPTPYNVVFLDPPFRLNLLEGVCNALSQGWLAQDALIYVEHEREGNFHPPATWHCLRQKHTGQVTYSLYQVKD